MVYQAWRVDVASGLRSARDSIRNNSGQELGSLLHMWPEYLSSAARGAPTQVGYDAEQAHATHCPHSRNVSLLWWFE